MPSSKCQPTALVIAIVVSFLCTTYLSYISNGVVQTDEIQCGFTTHFQAWLDSHGYSSTNFHRSDLKFCSSLGGKSTDSQVIKKTPVIFIHGNSDVGYGKGKSDGKDSWQTGFRSLADYLSLKGYTKAELYTFTWGSTNPNLASENVHSKQFVLKTRSFIEAVIAYTGASQVNVIGHSMGVTLSRKAIKGGKGIQYLGGSYEVGEPLTKKVHTFIGIAGANLGLTSCWTASSLPTCNINNGFFPGATALSFPSIFLHQLNNNRAAEATHVYSVWSVFDDIILYGSQVWGRITCRIDGQIGQVQKKSAEWGHFALRDNTGPDIYDWL